MGLKGEAEPRGVATGASYGYIMQPLRRRRQHGPASL
jgi:hypothetical protein